MAQISFRVDDNVKSDAEKILDTIGLSMSAAMNIFLKTVAREKRIPFELSADPFYSSNNMRYLEKYIVKNINAVLLEKLNIISQKKMLYVGYAKIIMILEEKTVILHLF